MKTEHSFFSRKSDTTIMRRTADDSPLDTKIQQQKMKIEENQTLMAPNQHSFVMIYVIDSIRCFSLAKSNLLIEGKKRWNSENISATFQHTPIFGRWRI